MLGYHIRLAPNGQYGIYAGKRMFRSYLLLKNAVQTLTRIVARKPTYHALYAAFDTWLNYKRK